MNTVRANQLNELPNLIKSTVIMRCSQLQTLPTLLETIKQIKSQGRKNL